jgi:predicted TIM-barrel fold metal-dependent hydrolase
MAEYRIIDADGHVMELDSELREFIGPPYNDLEWHQSYSFWPGLTMDGYLRSLRQKGGWAGGGDGPKANHWLDFLDKNKIELTVLYPTQGLTHAAIQDRDWAICMARAYNDWLYHKFMAVSPRLVGVALLPIQDISEAVKELRRCVDDFGMVGAVIPAVAPAGRLYSGPEFYPLWEEAQKLDVPVSTHGGLSMPSLGLDMVNNRLRRFASLPP